LLIRLAVLLSWLPAVALAGGYVFTVPEQIREAEMPGIMNSDGIPVQLKAAVSKESIIALRDYYVAEFTHAGLYIAPGREQSQPTRYPELTGLDVDRLVSYTVILQPNKDGSTTVIMGTADVSQLTHKTRPSDFAPLPPDATHISRMSTESQQLILFTVKQSEKELNDFYAKTLAGAGYAYNAAEGRYQRKDGWISVGVQNVKDQRYVRLEHGGAGAK
jgi:hypothetical protein